VVAGAVTGSVAILTEAIHSTIDLLASIVAFFSVRQAEEPPDPGHRYGHEKFENVAAGVEGMLILVGSGVIVYAAVNQLVEGGELHSLGFGIGVVAFAAAANLFVSAGCTGRRGSTSRRRWRPTPPTCARTRTRRSGSSWGSPSSTGPARPGSTPWSHC
jgi:cation diffusion facilitator family transporter